jgi:hypothetical protein
MGAAASKRELKRRLAETQQQLNDAHAECNKLNGVLLTFSWKNDDPSWYTAHGAMLRYGLSEEEVAGIKPGAEKQGHLLYSYVDLHPLSNRKIEERSKMLEKEAARYGVCYAGDFATYTCDWRSGKDLKSFEKVTMEAVQIYYLQNYTNLVFYMRELKRDDAEWPAVWPWCREAVLAEGWEWTPEVHNYWFGPKFKKEASTVVEGMDVCDNKAVAEITQLAKRLAAERGPHEISRDPPEISDELRRWLYELN